MISSKSKKYIAAFYLVIALMLCSSVALSAQNESVTVFGEAIVVKNNSVTAREKAIKNAMKKSLKEAVYMVLSSLTVDDNIILISEQIYPNYLSYIDSYKVLSESTQEELLPPDVEKKTLGEHAEEGELKKRLKFVVSLKAFISFEKLKSDLSALQILSKEKDLPRFVIFFAEKNIMSGEYEYFWGEEDNYVESTTVEAEITKRLMEKGLFPADMNKIKKKFVPVISDGDNSEPESLDGGQPKSGVSLEDSDVIELAKLTKGEIIIIGKALTHVVEEIPNTDMKLLLANVNARVINLEGNEIAADSTSEKMLHVDRELGAKEALKRASAVLADSLMVSIGLELGEEELEPSVVSLHVSGLSKKTYLDFMKLFKDDVRGVLSIAHKSYTTGGIADIDVKIKGGSKSLANELKKSSNKSFSVAVVALEDDSLEVVVSEPQTKEAIVPSDQEITAPKE